METKKPATGKVTPKPKAKPKPKPKPKPSKPATGKPKPKPKAEAKPATGKPKSKPKPKHHGSGITILRDSDESTNIDEYYERKMNGIIKKIKDQNQVIDDKIRFGWNNS